MHDSIILLFRVCWHYFSVLECYWFQVAEIQLNPVLIKRRNELLHVAGVEVASGTHSSLIRILSRVLSHVSILLDWLSPGSWKKDYRHLWMCLRLMATKERELYHISTGEILGLNPDCGQRRDVPVWAGHSEVSADIRTMCLELAVKKCPKVRHTALGW